MNVVNAMLNLSAMLTGITAVVLGALQSQGVLNLFQTSHQNATTRDAILLAGTGAGVLGLQWLIYFISAATGATLARVFVGLVLVGLCATGSYLSFAASTVGSTTSKAGYTILGIMSVLTALYVARKTFFHRV